MQNDKCTADEYKCLFIRLNRDRAPKNATDSVFVYMPNGNRLLFTNKYNN